MQAADERHQRVVVCDTDDPVPVWFGEDQAYPRQPDWIVGALEARRDHLRSCAALDDAGDLGRGL